MGSVYHPPYTERQADGTRVTKVAATWDIAFSVRGVRHRESSGSTKHSDAVRLLKQRIAEVGQGKPVGSQVERTTLDDLLAMVTADYAANSRKSGKRIPIAARHLREFFGGDSKARDITSDRVTAYVAKRLEEGAAKASVNVEQSFLSRGFRLAAKAGKVSARPEMSMLHLDNARAGFFEAAQFEAVVRHLPEHLKPVVQVAYLTGWRRSELLSRQWRHVDFNLGWLSLDPGETKNGKGRSFPFHNYPELREVIEGQRARVSAIEKATGQIISHVFVNQAGAPVVDFRNAWKTACRAAGCPGRLLHDFRRTAIRNFERRGLSRSAGMALSGHLTANIYSRYSIVDSAVLEEAVGKLTSQKSQKSQMSDQDSQRSSQVIAFPVKR
jgi:integrase